MIIYPISCTQRFNLNTHSKKTKLHCVKSQKPHGKQVLNSVQTQTGNLPLAKAIFARFSYTNQLHGSTCAEDLSGDKLVKSITSLIHDFAYQAGALELLGLPETTVTQIRDLYNQSRDFESLDLSKLELEVDIELYRDFIKGEMEAKDSLIELYALLIEHKFNVASLQVKTQELLEKYGTPPNEQVE